MNDCRCEVRSVEHIEEPVGTITKILVVARNQAELLATLAQRGYELMKITSVV